ncbi:MAG: TetR/AcrR family transcriptional regulator [Flavobacteriales bacterium]
MGNTRNNETRQRIVAAAMELFRSKGLHGVNMRELAEKAGVNKGLLHYYFKTKEAIFREVFVQQLALLYQEVGGMLEQEGSLHDKIPGWLTATSACWNRYRACPPS